MRPAIAQTGNQTVTDATSPAAVGAGVPASSYARSNIDSVDPYSGSVYVSIPLVTIGGRGAISYPLSLQLQSKWTLSGNVNNNQQVIGVRSSGAGGLSPWHPLLPGVVVSREAVSDPGEGYFDACTASGTPGAGYAYFCSTVVTKVTYLEPSGSEHEMVDVKTGGQALLPYTTPNCQIDPHSGTDRGRAYRATDGSNIVFVSDTDILDQIAFGDKSGPGPMQHSLSA